MDRSLILTALVGGLGLVTGHQIGQVEDATSAVARPARGLHAPTAPTVEPGLFQPPSAANGLRSYAWRRRGSDLVQPLMGCDPADTGGLEALQALVQPIVERAHTAGIASHVGVYVHDLVEGRSFGIDADGPFVPASIGKVPLLMVLLRTEEDARGTLGTPVQYPDWLRENDRQGIRSEATVQPGQTWTLGQLAEAMIVDSDNNATYLIRSQFEPGIVEQVYHDLGWHEQMVTVDGIQQTATTPRAIGGTFRVLYNATYLGEGTSDLALRLLSRAQMRDGLVAGVPPDVTVAHKFGEWSNTATNGSGVGQFHDCGIVYRPGRPYVACIMTRGNSIFQRPLIELVAEISRALWSGFEALPPPG